MGKREVKAPKVYVADTGLLHSLLGIGGRNALFTNPKYGSHGKVSFCVKSSGEPMQNEEKPFSGEYMAEQNWICWFFKTAFD